MPANLPPQYFEAEKRYRSAHTTAEKVAALQEMLAVMPKHKGTDHLKADLRAKMARLMDELERPSGPKSARTYPFAIRKEGAGQAVLVGLPNSGKSALLAALTGANVKVAPYPFTTQTPSPGMLRYENIYIQVVDTPAITESRLEGRLFGLLRNADVLVAVLDLEDDAAGQMEAILQALRHWGIEPAGSSEGGDTLGQPKPLLIAANKADSPGALDEYQRLEATYHGLYPLVLVSTLEGAGLDQFAREIFEALEVVRVFTKPIGREANLEEPMVLPQGSTIADAAISIHKEWQHKLKYAVLWGAGAKFEGQRVGRDHVLTDGDILELHG